MPPYTAIPGPHDPFNAQVGFQQRCCCCCALLLTAAKHTILTSLIPDSAAWPIPIACMQSIRLAEATRVRILHNAGCACLEPSTVLD